MTGEPNDPTAEARRRGRPRARRIDEAVLAAARELLRDGGAEAVTINAVAARSGVARASIYRRWCDRDGLLRALVIEIGEDGADAAGEPATSAGSLADAIASVNDDLARPELVSLLPQVVRDRIGRGATAGGWFAPAARHYAVIADAYRGDAVLGPLREDVDPALLADVVVGALLARRLRAGAVAARPEVAALTRVIVEGLRPRGPASD